MKVRAYFNVRGSVELDVPDDDPDTISDALSDWWYGNGEYEGVTTYEDVWEALQYNEGLELMDFRVKEEKE